MAYSKKAGSNRVGEIPLLKTLLFGPTRPQKTEAVDAVGCYLDRNKASSDLAQDIKMAASLSTTELRIASRIRNGMSSEEIPKHLHISLFTVKTHRKNIRKRLN